MRRARNEKRHLEAASVLKNGDSSQAYTETEVRSKHGDSHLGHVLPDGALPQGRAEILRQLGPPSRNPPRPIGV
ncbi:peptide-methionine (R)-S-oxide reductase [Bradyrhizobium sp. CAR08]